MKMRPLTAVLILCFCIPLIQCQITQLGSADVQSAYKLMDTSADIILDTQRRIERINDIRYSTTSAPFEVGYLVFTIQDKYRQMVDKYNTSRFMTRKLYLLELVLYLEEIEHHYWDINHAVNMLHEIERKYLIGVFGIPGGKDMVEDQDGLVAEGGLGPGVGKGDGKDGDADPSVTLAQTAGLFQTIPPHYLTSRRTKRYRTKRLKRTTGVADVMYKPTKKRKNKYWPIDYDISKTYQITLLSPERSIMNDLSWAIKSKILNEYNENNRRVGILHLRLGEDVTSMAPKSEDNSMKIKLFRLMYETVRDSDLKVRRAEMIRSHYANSTAFEIGFLMGDVQDKYNVITDISKTLQRLYREWKPMEHINAYEQIANKGIEIGHLIELIRVISKKNHTEH